MQADEREIGRVARFFSEERDRLSGYVKRRIRSADELDAEDIVQDVMLSLLQKAGITANVQSLPAYVYRALANRVTDERRARRPKISLQALTDENGEIPLMELLTDPSASVAGEAERREFLRRLGNALGRLDPKQRAVVLATEFEGRSYKDLSAEWKEPVGTLLSRKSRAVKALRELLKDYRNE